MTSLHSRLDRLEVRVTGWLARYGIALLRGGLGVVFFWFGALKFFPDASPAQDLAGRTIDVLTFGHIPPQVSLRILAAWECLIGLGLLGGIFVRATLLALLLQMLGTLTPLVFFPAETFVRVPYMPTLEGQYILKNIVLVTAAFTIGATVRGGGLVADPDRLGSRAVPNHEPEPVQARGRGDDGRAQARRAWPVRAARAPRAPLAEERQRALVVEASAPLEAIHDGAVHGR
jgi:uncharacterized membrane protein YphA (DoxX/SURF4 family)